jgi:peptidoglycan/LPS O-acetylase OafA/YrhL
MPRLPTLDGWRAFAVVAVLWHHATMSTYSTEGAFIPSVGRLGAFGVDIFFGLSGILITSLFLHEWRATGAISLKAFYTRRVFRIFPVYFLLLGVVAVAGLSRGPREIVACSLFLRNYLSGGWFTAHLWSLSVEEHFYLIWPAILVLGGIGRARAIGAWLAIAVGFWRILEPNLDLPFPTSLYRTDLRLDALLWGAVTAFTLHDPKLREKLRKELGAWPTLVMAAVVLFCFVYYSNLTSMFPAVMIPLILAATLLHPEWIISRVLELRPIAWVGRISYSLYIWQQLFMVPGWEHTTHFWAQWPWNLALIPVACASYYLIERPLIRIGARVARKVKERASQANLGLSREAAPASVA